MTAELAGRVAFVTGGSQGIGRAIVEVLAANGAAVGVCGLEAGRVEETVAAVGAAGGEALAVPADVTDRSSIDRAVAATVAQFGRLDALVTSAGIQRYGDVVDTDEATWDEVMAVNLKGVFLGCKHGIPALKRAGGGSVINVASFVAHLGAATPQLAYTASKGGVLAMTRELAVIHARQNIRVNALSPGPLRTELLMKFLNTEAKKQRRLVHIPMGRFGEAKEMAKAALFLASDDSSYMTGASLLVDGGITAAYVTPE